MLVCSFCVKPSFVRNIADDIRISWSPSLHWWRQTKSKRKRKSVRLSVSSFPLWGRADLSAIDCADKQSSNQVCLRWFIFKPVFVDWMMNWEDKLIFSSSSFFKHVISHCNFQKIKIYYVMIHLSIYSYSIY